jgi:hypothetical protein
MEALLLIPLIFTLICFMIVAARFKRLYERSLAREKRLSDMLSQRNIRASGDGVDSALPRKTP